MTQKVPASMTTEGLTAAALAGKVSATGDETVAGIKTFSSQPVLPQASVLAAVQATTSGTTKDFTSIPAWVKKITVIVAGFSHASGSNAGPIVQIGSGSFDTTGYTSAASVVLNASTTSAAGLTTGLQLSTGVTAASVIDSLVYTLVHVGGNLWVGAGSGASNATVATYQSGGKRQLAGVLDRLRFTTDIAATMDAGSVTVIYE